MEDHEKFREWVTERGVKIDGITAHKFEGRGVGIIAEKRLKADSTILTVPISALRTAHTLPKALQPLLKSAPTIHGILALMLALDTSPTYQLWCAVLPTASDFESTMPLHYPSSLQDLLPSASKALLAHQKSKLKADWAFASSHYPKLTYDDYLYAWLLVNTRTFYFLPPGTKTPKNHDDCMALNPFADYFNHTSRGCHVSFTAEGYKVMTNKVYEKGEEVFISYGNHSNDFLLAEYGFILPSSEEPGGNEWDVVSLDDYILPLLSAEKKELLKESGFLGNYVLDNAEVCYRTQVALRAQCLSTRKWQRFMDGSDDGADDQEAVNEVLLKALKRYHKDTEKYFKQVSATKEGEESHRDMLSRRWKQISNLLQREIDRIQN
ncbi:SET domain-containing protein [Mollisia scopiformis]|uniref:SET domain-containing protein n=1 Tax=Mollisia scopiformis TaxID=149040 RepID=A0A132B6H5_MOLSC|nr:SET domain-containing protein [Mollisia scopiformis]KUJ07277.1 SET domain-containing protein [Mollisia scopiformis]